MKIELGKLAEEEGHKDALHVAVVSVEAGEDLEAGTKVHMLKGSAYQCGSVSDREADGIVDPFLTKMVREGECFWLLLAPGKVKNLRHDWQHDAFDDAIKKNVVKDEAAVAWIKQFCEEEGLEYEDTLKRTPYDVLEDVKNEDNECRGCW